jgi:acyl-CoA hydrolase
VRQPHPGRRRARRQDFQDSAPGHEKNEWLAKRELKAMFDWRQRFSHKLVDAETAVRVAESGQRVFVGSGAAEPQLLVAALSARADELVDMEIVHILTLGAAPYADPRYSRAFRHNALFIGANVRAAVAAGRADYTPVFLSEIPRLFRSGRIPWTW